MRVKCLTLSLTRGQTWKLYPGMSAPIMRPLPLQEGMAFIYLQVSKVFCNFQVSIRMALTYLQDLKQGKRT